MAHPIGTARSSPFDGGAPSQSKIHVEDSYICLASVTHALASPWGRLCYRVGIFSWVRFVLQTFDAASNRARRRGSNGHATFRNDEAYVYANPGCPAGLRSTSYRCNQHLIPRRFPE